MPNTDFSYRLQRARCEPFKILRFLDSEGASAEIHSVNSGNTYTVTLNTCTCEDSRKHRSFFRKSFLCKHTMFLMLSTGRYRALCREVCGDRYPLDEDRFIPNYLLYYGGGPTGLGYTNLYPYEVSGRLYGTSPKTGRPTNRKKVVCVNASGFEDARATAQSLGVMPPYQSVRLINSCPTVNQLNYIHGLRIPYPSLANSDDIRALLTRYQDTDDDLTPSSLFRLATDLRVRVSYFDSPRLISAYIWNCIPEDRRPALFCYAVFCKECSSTLGNTAMPHTHPVFSSFTPTPAHLKYFSKLTTLYDPSKRSSAYRAAVTHLCSHQLLSPFPQPSKNIDEDELPGETEVIYLTDYDD